MLAFVFFVIGIGIGAGFMLVMTLQARRAVNSDRKELWDTRRKLEAQGDELREQRAKLAADWNKAISDLRGKEESRNRELEEQRAQVANQQASVERSVITFSDLQRENAVLKRDLQNIDVNLHKLELDRERDRENQAVLDQRVREMATRYLKDNVKSVGASINANNYVACKQRLLKVIDQCRELGFEIPEQEEGGLVADLKKEFEEAVRTQLRREEQARIKAQIREEQKRERDIQREVERAQRERDVIQAALDKALADAKQQHTIEVEQLETRLKEAEAKCERAISQAQLTKAGYIYVISNIGSFGKDVYKIGMTRRLEPQERVDELGDASVPFPFDVHMMIYSEDAPKLETALHHTFHKLRVNKLKPRKEFYRVDLDAIAQVVKENHGDVQYVAEPEALEYRQSLVTSDEDAEFVEQVWDESDDEGKTGPEH